jgi:hypothetical protein
MAASEFFKRWARRKAHADGSLPESADASPEAGTAPESAGTVGTESALSAPAQIPENALPPRLPTLEDAALLTSDGNFVPFMAEGVDDAVRRAALKKLFADPQFNIMDGLDIYVGDYSNMETMPESMLRQLNHARDLLDPLGTLERAAQSVERERQANLALERSNAGPGTGDTARDAAGDTASDTASADPSRLDDALMPAGSVKPTAVSLRDAALKPDASALPDTSPLPDALLSDPAMLTDETLLPVEALLFAAQAAIDGNRAGETAVLFRDARQQSIEPASSSSSKPKSGDAPESVPSEPLDSSEKKANSASVDATTGRAPQ